jgi:hypothetical protein
MPKSKAKIEDLIENKRDNQSLSIICVIGTHLAQKDLQGQEYH